MNIHRPLSSVFIFAVVATGCAGAQEEWSPVTPSTPNPPLITERRSIEAPDVVLRAIKKCVDSQHISVSHPSSAFQYDVEANDRGQVSGVKLRDATLRDASLEQCFEQALATMDLPKEALQLRASKPFSGGEIMSRSRGDVGVVQAVVAPIALAPIVVTALGVTIIVAISIDIVRNATSGPDCKEVKQDCIAACNPKLPTPDFGFKFWNCVNRCMATAGC